MFERFTDRARQVMVLAQNEARSLDHNYIGTEHLLLGLLNDRQSIAGRALTASGISLDAIRLAVIDAVGRGKKPAKGHIPFTPRAKKVLELALREALQLGHNYIGTEHILLGMIREGQGLAATVLATRTDLAALRRAVMELIPPSEERTSWGWRRFRRGRPEEPESARTTRAADSSLEQARQLAGAGAIGSHHLLLAALGDADSAAAKALAALGVNLDDAREALRTVDVAGTSDELPEEEGRRALRLRLAGDSVTLETSQPVVVAQARAAMEAVGGDVASSGVLRGDLDIAGSLADVWQSLRDALADITRRAGEQNAAAATGEAPEPPEGKAG